MPSLIAFLMLAFLAACHKHTTGQPDAPIGSPRAPSHLTLERTSVRVRLTWRDNSNDETAFVIERQISDRAWEDHKVLSANVVSHEEILPFSSHWRFRVRASNAAGRSQHSNLVEVQTPDRPRSGCGLVLATELSESTSNSGQARLLMFTERDGQESIISRARWTGAPAVLESSEFGRATIELERRPRAGGTHLAMTMRFAALTARDDGLLGELCLLVHDSSNGKRYEDSVPATKRRRHVAHTVWNLPISIHPGRPYEVDVLIDAAAQNYSVRHLGTPIARDVDLRDVLVVPVRYVHGR